MRLCSRTARVLLGCKREHRRKIKTDRSTLVILRTASAMSLPRENGFVAQKSAGLCRAVKSDRPSRHDPMYPAAVPIMRFSPNAGRRKTAHSPRLRNEVQLARKGQPPAQHTHRNTPLAARILTLMDADGSAFSLGSRFYQSNQSRPGPSSRSSAASYRVRRKEQAPQRTRRPPIQLGQ